MRERHETAKSPHPFRSAGWRRGIYTGRFFILTVERAPIDLVVIPVNIILAATPHGGVTRT